MPIQLHPSRDGARVAVYCSDPGAAREPSQESSGKDIEIKTGWTRPHDRTSNRDEDRVSHVRRRPAGSERVCD
eukprot:3555725-Alexandrium_andersonii.AAC.1